MDQDSLRVLEEPTTWMSRQYLKPTTIPEAVPTLDNTMAEAFERCARLYFLRHVLGLRPIRRSAALGYGGLIHEALDTWYETKDTDKVAEKLLSAEFEEIEDDFRTRARAVQKMKDYMDWYGDEKDWLDNGMDDIILTETAFDLKDDLGFRWGGKIDLVVIYREEPWVMDHKTTARFGDSYWDQFRNSSQMAGYVWAASILHGRPITGVLINCIVTHKIPKPASAQLHRAPIYYDAMKIEEWKQSKIRTYQNIYRCMMEEYWPPCWRNCTDKYGKCPFFSVCSAPAETRMNLIAQDYEVEHWDWRKEEGDDE